MKSVIFIACFRQFALEKFDIDELSTGLLLDSW